MVEGNHQPISDFLLVLFNATKPFHDVLSFFWDLNPFNEKPLNDIAVRNILIDVKKVGDATLYILRPNSDQSIRDTPWAVSV